MSSLQNLWAAVRRTPYVSLLLTAVALGVHFSPTAQEWLEYDRSALAAGQWWRIVTCHLTHCSLDHLVWDVGALVVLGFLCEVDDRRRFVRCGGLTAVCIPAALWFLKPEVATYRGLSGIDSALFVLLAVSLLKESLAAGRTAWAAATILVLCGFLGKLGYELATSQTLFVRSAAAGMVPIPLAHLIGGLIGAAIAMCRWHHLDQLLSDGTSFPSPTAPPSQPGCMKQHGMHNRLVSGRNPGAFRVAACTLPG